MQHVAIYCRVSKRNGQDVRSQLPDLERWANAQDQPVRWYQDQFTGKTMDQTGLECPGIRHCSRARCRPLCAGVSTDWARTAKGLTSLFADLQEKRVNLVSLKDGLDLSTPAGRLMANVLASVAQFETEVRAERILAGQAAARAAGKTWGGGKPGRRVRLSEEKERTIKLLHEQGKGISEISRVVGLSRPTIYRVLG